MVDNLSFPSWQGIFCISSFFRWTGKLLVGARDTPCIHPAGSKPSFLETDATVSGKKGTRPSRGRCSVLLAGIAKRDRLRINYREDTTCGQICNRHGYAFLFGFKSRCPRPSGEGRQLWPQGAWRCRWQGRRFAYRGTYWLEQAL